MNEDNSFKNNNTTLLLKKMYSMDTQNKNPPIDRMNEAAVSIQKSYRGYLCRKIMREKLRIDKEFRILR